MKTVELAREYVQQLLDAAGEHVKKSTQHSQEAQRLTGLAERWQRAIEHDEEAMNGQPSRGVAVP